MRSLATFFGLEKLAPEKVRALSIVYAASLALMMGINFIQPALPALTKPFEVTDAQLSWIMTLFTAPAIFLSPVFGVIADLYGRRLLLAYGLMVFGLFGAAMAFAPNYNWLLVFRTLQGIGFAAVIPLTIVLIGDLLEGDKEISGQGLKVFLDRVGYFIFPPLGGLLATIAWFWPFVFYVLAIPLGLIALFCMPETQSKHKQGATNYLGDILRLSRHPRLLIAFTAGFLRFFLDYGFLTYFPLFLVRTHGISTATAGLLYVFFAIGAMMTSSQAGRIAAGRDKANILFLAFAVSGASVLAVPFIPGVWLVGGALFFLRPRQWRDLAYAEKSAHAKRAGGTARRYRFLRSLDPAGFQNHFDVDRRTVVGERGVADDLLDARNFVIYQHCPDGAAAAAQRENSADPEL